MSSFFCTGGATSPTEATPSGGKVRRISSLETGKTLELSAEELKAIRKSWKSVKNKPKLAEQIFFTIFTMKPALRKPFGIDEALDPVRLMSHPILVRHAAAFANFLDTVVHELESSPYRPPGFDWRDSTFGAVSGSPSNSGRGSVGNVARVERGENETLIEVVRDIGLLHCQVTDMSFAAENWLVFKSAILESLAKTERHTDKTYRAWNKFISFIISEMKDGYYSGVRRNTWPTSTRSSTASFDNNPPGPCTSDSALKTA